MTDASKARDEELFQLSQTATDLAKAEEDDLSVYLELVKPAAFVSPEEEEPSDDVPVNPGFVLDEASTPTEEE